MGRQELVGNYQGFAGSGELFLYNKINLAFVLND